MAENVEPATATATATAATTDSDAIMVNDSSLISPSEDVTAVAAEQSTTTGTTGTPGTESSETPAAFPARRRGRPPGRPNMTVKEADFEDNPLVQKWNAAKTERPIIVHAVTIREALTEASLVHETQKDVFKMPSREVIYFVSGWITARHIASRRPSYVNGLLIHSRGNDATNQCVQCVDRRNKNALGPFPSCRTLPGKYGDSCSNCKWFDNTSSCSWYTGPKPNRKRKSKASTDDDSPEGDAERNRNGSASASAQEQPAQEPSPTTDVTSNHHLLHPDLLVDTGNQNLNSEGSNSNSHQQNDSPIAGMADDSDARLAEELQSAMQ